MSKFGIGGGSKPPAQGAGVVDLAAARVLLQQEQLEKLAQGMQREGHPPDAIKTALDNQNAKLGTPLDEDALATLVAPFAAGYVSRLAKVDMEGFMQASYPAPTFVVNQLIPRDEVTLGGGHGGSGKSILFLALAAHVASGKGWDRFDVAQCPVVFISLEDQGVHVMHRLKKIVGTYLLDHEAVANNLQVFDGSDSPELMIEVNEFGTHRLMPTQMMREIESAVAGAGLVIIDNASDAYGGNENERRSVRTFIRHLAGIARANKAAVVLLAHIDKAAARDGGSGNNYSGSTAWHNSTRSRLALVEVEGQLQLHHEKHNRSQQAEPVNLTWTGDGVLVPGHSATAAAARDELENADTNAALRAMLAALEHGIHVPAGTRGTSTAWSALEALPEMETFWGKNGKRRFNTAILTLQNDNLLVRRESWNEQNNLRAQLELTALGEAAARRIAP